MRIPTYFLINCLLFFFVLQVNSANRNDGHYDYSYPDIINIKNVPTKIMDMDKYVFSDQGAWHGYALPEKDQSDIYGGFIGPRIMTGSAWVSRCLSQAHILVNGKDFNFARNCQSLTYYPGRLVQLYSNPLLTVKMELIFASNRTAIIQTEIKNNSAEKVTLEIEWKGELFDTGANISSISDGVKIYLPSSKMVVLVCSKGGKSTIGNQTSFSISSDKDTNLLPGQSLTETITQSVVFNETEATLEYGRLNSFLDNYQDLSVKNNDRWNQYFEKLFSHPSDFTKDEQNRKLAIKTVMTLLTNWRSPALDMLHEGIFPSYVGFCSFWAWDSWKHAAGVATFAPELAKNQIRAMFDYQDEHGMIPDMVRLNKKGNNWRDTKPPLAAWAVYLTFQESGDKAFVAEMIPKLMKYHYWWYQYRDNNKNGLCEFGSTDGTLIAAAWESGMDNAVRFDKTVMVKNELPDSWSMDQESVDLNSFLYAEKIYLSKLLEISGDVQSAGKLKKEAEQLKTQICSTMFDGKSGFFFDKRLKDDSLVTVMGAEGWLPLWAKAATAGQALSVSKVVNNTSKFNSTIPFGTLAVDDINLQPYNGYWRGPVWIDQVYFGVVGLKNYGFTRQSNEMFLKYLHNAEGLLGNGPIHENYNPLTGERLNSPHFSWSSALTLRMLLNL